MSPCSVDLTSKLTRNEVLLAGEEIVNVVRFPGQYLSHPHVAQLANQRLDLHGMMDDRVTNLFLITVMTLHE